MKTYYFTSKKRMIRKWGAERGPIHITGKVFDNEGQAVEYVKRNHSFWKTAIAVQFYYNLKKKLKEKVTVLNQKYSILLQEEINSFLNKKTNIKCSNCGKMNKRDEVKTYYATHNEIKCPGCGVNVLGKTAQKKLKKALDIYEKARIKYINNKDLVKYWVCGM